MSDETVPATTTEETPAPNIAEPKRALEDVLAEVGKSVQSLQRRLSRVEDRLDRSPSVLRG